VCRRNELAKSSRAGGPLLPTRICVCVGTSAFPMVGGFAVRYALTWSWHETRWHPSYGRFGQSLSSERKPNLRNSSAV